MCSPIRELGGLYVTHMRNEDDSIIDSMEETFRIGREVGYQIRFERRLSARTRIEVVTEGLLARRLQADPELPGVGLLIFDEFHERSLDADLALALKAASEGAMKGILGYTVDPIVSSDWTRVPDSR